MKKNDPADKRYMALAISLAKKGTGKTSPNPAVGAVLVKNGKIIAADYHKKAGLPHAEALVMKKAGRDARGATLYCTLEACTHYGKTPPCADMVIKSGIKRAVFAMKDPNPINDGKGIAKLKRAGVETECGLMEAGAKRLNRPFIKFMKKRLPYVTIKIAESLDGKTADSKGNSKWITSEGSRKLVHRLRAQNDAVMIGINTLLKDNPLLTNRYYRAAGRQPLRVILDTELRTPTTSRVLKRGKDCGAVLIAGGRGASAQKKSALEKKGAEVVFLPVENGRVKLVSLLKYLGNMGVMSVLCEGGGEIVSSLIRERLADEIYFFIAPEILGGKLSPTACGGPPSDIKHPAGVKNIKIEKIGPDILIRGDL
ncbi:MAG: bifunctional diaminohydroxyphosphoribosylaminopyrimidine deaminase/5-amino-6-(5-phosphoribosylamino)uracil reductase RibD [Candidatus Omnitrophica bacterium]|nr:bifunctional diaminohydroxyphosphoribosylaminopyrimidine deaminase/5-amino-6-(5-phosphoribosylamino)uracil reductase RibD [Candidatus Omnitrophota bacterium]